MTNEEAIYCMMSYLPEDTIEKCVNCKYYESGCKSSEAHLMAISALESQNIPTQMTGTSDAVSRQGAIDLAHKLIVPNEYKYGLYNQAINNYCVEIMQLPSAQPRSGKWILDEDPHDGDCRCSICRVSINQMHERNHGLLNALTGGKWWTFYNFCPNCGAYMRS